MYTSFCCFKTFEKNKIQLTEYIRNGSIDFHCSKTFANETFYTSFLNNRKYVYSIRNNNKFALI